MPQVLDTSVYDEVIHVTDDEAFDASRLLARRACSAEYHPAPPCTRAAVLAKAGKQGKTIAVILPDTGERYLSVL